ncbi:MAG: hypothetical protein HYU66_00270 [Armatimonadetes bacterium]|nr:hypothetical protein [Armatimonadota bacterium]
MPDNGDSVLHLDPTALNAILRTALAGKEDVSAELVDGRLEVQKGDLRLTVTSVKLDEGGLEVRLRLA